MYFLKKEEIEKLCKEYPAGCRVELVQMDDPYNNKLHPGCQGNVVGIDDTGTIFVNWDCGSSLGLVLGVDKYKKI